MRSAFLLVVSAATGCDDAAGIRHIQFGLRPARALAVEEGVVDPFEAGDAEGVVELHVEDAHLMAFVQRLPRVADPGWGYRLWLSASDPIIDPVMPEGDGLAGRWALAGRLEPGATGRAEAHAGSDDLDLDLATVRQAVVTIDRLDAERPSSAIVLLGGTGLDPEEEGQEEPGGGGGGHEH